MKIASLCIFILIVLGISASHAQSVQKIPVPVVKENKLIDSFMNMVLIKSDRWHKINPSLPYNSCWCLEIFKGKQYPIFQIHSYNEQVINYLVNQTTNGVSNYGYFQYQGYAVFVWLYDGFDDYFSMTPGLSTFSFVYKSGNQAQPSDESLNSMMQMYKYVDGRFQDPGPPVVDPRSAIPPKSKSGN